MISATQIFGRCATIAFALLITTEAWALRCGNRLIKEEMPEAEVIALCGEPVEAKYLGYVLRTYILKRPAGSSSLIGTRHVYCGFHEYLLVKEFKFNLWPRK